MLSGRLARMKMIPERVLFLSLLSALITLFSIYHHNRQDWDRIKFALIFLIFTYKNSSKLMRG